MAVGPASVAEGGRRKWLSEATVRSTPPTGACPVFGGHGIGGGGNDPRLSRRAARLAGGRQPWTGGYGIRGGHEHSIVVTIGVRRSVLRPPP